MQNIKVTDTDIKNQFRTTIQGGILYVYDRNSNLLILQSRIIAAADPIRTIEYTRDICKEIIKYKKLVYKDFCG